MRRLVILASALVGVDTVLYTAMTPLLPHYAAEFGLGKSGSGILVAAYAAGALIGGVPGGLAASRFGPKRAVLTGIALVSLSSVAFAFAPNALSLEAARFAQGFGSALTWAGALSWLVAVAPRERRGELIGAAMGAAIFGALAGPAFGALAGSIGVHVVFTGFALAGVLLAAWAIRSKDAPPQPARVRELVWAFRDRRFAAGLWLTLLPSLLFGIRSVLATLALGRDGWGATAIGATFIAGALLEAVLAPVFGRYSDRRGRMLPLRVSLVASVAGSIALAIVSGAPGIAVLVIATSVAFGTIWAPALALLADAAESRGLAQGLSWGGMNSAWAIGNVVGAAAAGALAEGTSDTTAYLAGAILVGATLVAVTPQLSARGRLRSSAATAPGTRSSGRD